MRWTAGDKMGKGVDALASEEEGNSTPIAGVAERGERGAGVVLRRRKNWARRRRQNRKL